MAFSDILRIKRKGEFPEDPTAAQANPANQIPADWDAMFRGTARFNVTVAAIKELHLRMLVLEGNFEEERRLRELHSRKIGEA